MDDYLIEAYGPLMTIEELAIVLKTTKQTLYKKLSTNKLNISHIKIGKKYLFNTSKVASYCDTLLCA